METVQSADKTTIALEQIGEGPSVVIIGGALSTRGSEAELASLLGAQFTAITYDRRGRGDSGDTQRYAPEQEIEDLKTLIENANGVEGVFGSSSGGNLALHTAASGYGVNKLALWEPNFVVSDDRPPLPDDYVRELENLVESGRRGDAVEYFMTAAVGLPAEFVAPMREAPMWAGMEAVAHTLAYDGRIVGNDMGGSPVSPDRWSAVEGEVLVIDGGTTPWLTDGADSLAQALPNARRATLAGQQHNVSADALAPLLLEFFGR